MIKKLLFIVLWAAVATGCAGPRINLFTDASDPLQEATLSGSGTKKILVVHLTGLITDSARSRLVRTLPSPVSEIVSRLDAARADRNVKALVLAVDSPGGKATGSDVIYREIVRFKEETGAPVVAALQGIAASGGYYAALPADRILVHPTTITGSVGAIFLRPKVTGLMEMVGVDLEVAKSGRNKDMGSPFRPTTDEEAALFQSLIQSLADRFVQLVQKHRHLSPEALETVKTARVFHADEALALGLADAVGYLDDAVAAARELAGLPADARVVAFRRGDYPNDNIYNAETVSNPGPSIRVDLGLPVLNTGVVAPGFYYLWTPGM